MTIKTATKSHIEYGASTTSIVSPVFSDGSNISISIDNNALAGVGSFKKSRTGKLPRSVIRATAESKDVSLRARMQEARVELAAEFLSDAPNSLSKLRLSRGYSQQQLARLVGTSQPHIANLEAGKIDPQFGTVVRLADALGVSLDTIRPLIISIHNRHNSDVN